MKDYYKVLGVSPGAPKEVIKAAYRAQMKKHHPDVGGDSEKAKEIEEAYRRLSRSPVYSDPTPTPGQEGITVAPTVMAPTVCGGRHLQIQVVEMLPNQVFPCPRECGFYHRNCRHKQGLSLESKDLLALRASILILQVGNQANYSQKMDCANGRAVLVDQAADFYYCQQVCSWLHPPRYKEGGVELFPGTRATVQLWFPQLPPGRWPLRFVYKHKILVRDTAGDWQDEEIIDLPLH